MDKNDPRLKAADSYGNFRLVQLRDLILSGISTAAEEEEFEKILSLANQESGGDKPWREHPEWYEETAKLRKENIALRTNPLILETCKKNLERGRAVATGIGVFTVLIDADPCNPLKFLLRRRQEKDSLYGKDLSGKWEMIGGGVEIEHFEGQPVPYQAAILNALRQELQEEAGLVLQTALPKYSFLIPAWHFDAHKGIIDLAFVMPIPWKWARETEESQIKLKNREIRFFQTHELEQTEIVSPRTKFLIKEAIGYAEYYWS